MKYFIKITTMHKLINYFNNKYNILVIKAIDHPPSKSCFVCNDSSLKSNLTQPLQCPIHWRGTHTYYTAIQQRITYLFTFLLYNNYYFLLFFKTLLVS